MTISSLKLHFESIPNIIINYSYTQNTHFKIKSTGPELLTAVSWWTNFVTLSLGYPSALFKISLFNTKLAWLSPGLLRVIFPFYNISPLVSVRLALIGHGFFFLSFENRRRRLDEKFLPCCKIFDLLKSWKVVKKTKVIFHLLFKEDQSLFL